MQAHNIRSRRLAALCIPTAIALAACGGSDDPPAGAPLPAGIVLSLSGTAATGGAIAGGTVESRCDGDSGGTTTASDGSYTIELSEGRLPCVLQVTSADRSTVLHSVAVGSGNAVTAHITPASELIVAQLAGGDPAALFASFGAAQLGSTKVQDAAAAVGSILGADFAGIDLLAGTLEAGNAADPYDKALEALKSKLDREGLTLATLRDSVVRASPDAPATALSATPSLPAELLLRPAAPNCAALRSGSYRVGFFAPGEGGQAFTDTLVLDAPTLTATASDGEVSTLVATGECQYSLASGGEMVVTPAGVAALRSGERPGFVAGLAFPEQQHPVSVTAGTWNYLGLGDINGSFGAPQLFGGEMTVDRTGQVTAEVFCDDLNSCVAETPDAQMAFTANPAGGFNLDGSRSFAYRAGGGELLIVSIDRDGSFALATRKVARGLPAVGSVSRSWNFTITPQYGSPFALSSSDSTTVSLASDGGSYLRNAIIDLSTGTTRPETVQINVPREGFIHRVPQTVSTSTGGSSVVGEWVGLTLRGIGITPVAIVANNQLVLSVNKRRALNEKGLPEGSPELAHNPERYLL